MVRETSGEVQEQMQSAASCVKHGGANVIAWACMAADGMSSFVLINDDSADRSIKTNSEVYRALYSAPIQPIAAK